MASLRVGLTGGLASGKSTVAGWLAEVPGFLVVDADRLVGELYSPGAAGARAVFDLFGTATLHPSGEVAREKLASRIFSDPTARAALEAAVHPLVRERFAAMSAAHPGIAVLEATLLIEAGYSDMFDRVVSVEAPAKVRLARAIARGLPEAAARSRLDAQGDGALRRAAADRILDSSGDLVDLRRQVRDLVHELESLAAGSGPRRSDQP